MEMCLAPFRAFLGSALLIGLSFTSGCAPVDAGSPVLQADVPLHLEEHLDAATIVGSEVPADLVEPVEWWFDEPQLNWRPVRPIVEGVEAVRPVRVDDALRVSLTVETHAIGRTVFGMIYVDLPDWNLEDWGYVEIRARTHDLIGALTLAFNLTDEINRGLPFEIWAGDQARLVADGTVQTYRLSLDHERMRTWEGPWTHLGIWFQTAPPEELEKATLDILSVTVVPKEATYAGEPSGVHSEVRNRVYSRALYTHAPARVEYRVRVPEAGRLDLGLGVLREDAPVTFWVTAAPGGGEPETVLEETYDDKNNWGQRSIDLSHLAGQTVDLALETESPRPGTVALWAAPTLTGAASPEKPNVIFYVIDGGAADFMSVYGYNRRTTPYMEQLAAEGALFEWAYSNSTWTKPSTASFMTSLQNSVMGGQTNWTDPVPEQIKTMAEHMHQAGHQTAVFIANPSAGVLSNLQRGVDVMQESWEEFTEYRAENHKQSSRFLQERFFKWREAYPGGPYWVHFQTTDVHGPHDQPSPAPFSGLFVGPEQRRTWLAWRDSLGDWRGRSRYGGAWDETGIDRVAYFTVWQALYDEAMAYNDYQIGRLVERLKAAGEWENTLLVVAADHSVLHAGSDQGVALQDSVPPRGNSPILRSTISRVPLMFVWPGRIDGGQRFSHPVSMLDVLPTILDLAGLPMPEVVMGQSLAPLLLGTDGWEPRPVILDEFYVDQATGELRGLIEVIDGRWGASLQINWRPPDGVEDDEEEEEPLLRRPVPLLLYDRWADPFALHSLHEERPDLAKKYTVFLEAQWEAHQALGQRFTQSGEVALTPQQLETLRSLGYIQ